MRTNNSYVLAHYTDKGRIVAKDADGEVLRFASPEEAERALLNIHFPAEMLKECRVEVEADGEDA